MKYVDVKTDKKFIKAAEKEYLKSLSVVAAKRYKKKRICDKIIYVILFIVFLICCFLYCLFGFVEDFGDTQTFASIIYFFGVVAFSFLTVAVFAGILFGISGRIFKDVDTVVLDYEVRKNARTKMLNEGYGMGEKFIVTKCFCAFKSSLNYKDVYVFPFEDKLRILDFNISCGYIELDLKKFVIENPETEENLQYGKQAVILREGKQEVVLGKKAFIFINGLIKADSE